MSVATNQISRQVYRNGFLHILNNSWPTGLLQRNSVLIPATIWRFHPETKIRRLFADILRALSLIKDPMSFDASAINQDVWSFSPTIMLTRQLWVNPEVHPPVAGGNIICARKNFLYPN
jgi:hypothetical protein